MAMLPNGPACTSTGVFSSVCSRFGLIASRRITAIDPAPCSCSAVTGVPGRGVADDDPPEPGPQVRQRRGQRERGHHLGGGGDVEPGLPGDAVGLREPSPITMLRSARSLTSSTRRQVMSCRSRPSCVALVQVVVDHRGQQVVRGGDRVHVAGQVQVQHLHRDDLAVAAARGAALDAERRPHRRLPDGDRGPLADVAERLAEPDGRGGLALAERGRGDRGDHDVLGLRRGRRARSIAASLIFTTCSPYGSSRCSPMPSSCGDVVDRLERRRPGDVEVASDCHDRLLRFLVR